jgi:hypothetical protein
MVIFKNSKFYLKLQRRVGMSVNALLKRLDALRGEYESVRDSLVSISNEQVSDSEIAIKNILKLDSFLAECEQLVVNIEKFVSKKDAKDPVSGESRFGPTMVKKMTQGYADAEALRNEIVTTKAQYNDIRIRWEEETANASIVSVVEEPIMVSAVVDSSIDNNLFLSAEAANKLRIEAEKSKLMRETHRIELDTFVSSMNNSALTPTYLIDALNKLNSPNMNKYKLKNIFKSVTDIMEGIVGHPDNVKLRKLKVGNPRLLEDVTGFTGGVDVLVALGFRLQLEEADIAAQLASTPHSDKGSIQEYDEVVMKTLQSLKVTNLELFLHMEEPDPLGDEWYPWFNGLKERLQILCDYCARK